MIAGHDLSCPYEENAITRVFQGHRSARRSERAADDARPTLPSLSFCDGSSESEHAAKPQSKQTVGLPSAYTGSPIPRANDISWLALGSAPLDRLTQSKERVRRTSHFTGW